MIINSLRLLSIFVFDQTLRCDLKKTVDESILTKKFRKSLKSIMAIIENCNTKNCIPAPLESMVRIS